jgi:NADPH2:quinone reductase
MKAVGLSSYGGPDVLVSVDLPVPHAGPGEVRMRVHAAAVSPVDTLIRSGAAAAAFGKRSLYLPGLDAAGVIDEVGEGAHRMRIGDRVMAMVNPTRAQGGAYVEYLVLAENYVSLAPARTTHAEASTLPMNGLTARLALDRLALRPGDALAVTGAAGAVGGYAVQLAKAEGLWVVADASPADHELVKSLGADEVVPRGNSLAHALRELQPAGVDAAIDAALVGEPLVAAVRDHGSIAVVRGRPSAGLERGITYVDVYVHDYDGAQGKLEQLKTLADCDQVALRVAQVMPYELAPHAHRLLEAGGIRGRLVLDFSTHAMTPELARASGAYSTGEPSVLGRRDVLLPQTPQAAGGGGGGMLTPALPSTRA